MFDIVTVGHFSIDFIELREGKVTKPTLGGPPTYVSLAARSLRAKASVLSKVGDDFPLGYVTWLRNQGVDLSGLERVEGALTTSFVLHYYGEGDRQLFLKNRAPSIEARDIPDSFKAKAVHLAPIANEIPYSTAARLRAKTSSVSLDPQGLLRRFRQDGKTYPGSIENPEILRITDVFKGSLKEIRAITGESGLAQAMGSVHKQGVKTVIVTRGAEGSLVSVNGELYRVPAAKPRIVVDTTGSGDVFVGAFLAEYIRGEEPVWCASVGSACASFVIEKLGPRGFGSQREVYERAAEVYGKTSAVAKA